MTPRVDTDRPAADEHRTRATRARRVAVGGLVAVSAAAALIVTGVLGDGDGRRLDALFASTNGLVEGAKVQAGGVDVGTVERIRLDAERPRVTLRLDDGRVVRRGARADIRLVSLSGQLNRVVAIEDGPAGAPALRDGATLGRTSTDQPVEVEDVLSTLAPATRADVRAILRGARRATDGRGPALAASLRRAQRGLRATSDVLGDVTADGAALRDVVASTAKVTRSLAAAPGRTGAAVDALAGALGDAAAEQEALRATLRELPSGLRAPRATLARLDRQLPALRRLVANAGPAVRAGRAIAPEAREALDGAAPVVSQARRLTADGPAQLRALVPLLDEARPLLAELRPALERGGPILDEARVRMPDFFSFFSNWADFTSNYDANGHGARVGLILPPVPNRVASPDGQAAGHLERPFLRVPGSLQGEPWTGYRSSFVSPTGATPAATRPPLREVRP